MTIIYILAAIFMFGLLIAIHEFGHFVAAKSLGVKVNEFAIGMGPKLLRRRKGETEYTLRLFPIGGFCAMEGEGEDSKDPRAFNNQAAWKRFVILVAGAALNFLTGVLIFLILALPKERMTTTTLERFMEGFPLQSEQGLLPGDRILSVDGNKIYQRADIDLFFARAGETMDLVVERRGEKVVLKGLPLVPRQYPGQEDLKYGLYFSEKTATMGDKLRLAWDDSIGTVRLVWVGLGDMVTGRVGLRQMSGVVGIVDMVGQAGNEAQAEAQRQGQNVVSAVVRTILRITGLIAVNLAVMNLLPIPALDGGQILFLLVDRVYGFFTKKRINTKYLGYINAGGLLLLLAFMAVIAVSDVMKLFGR